MIPAGVPQRYRFALPNQNYVFKPRAPDHGAGPVDLFPLYDRNPQTFVADPFSPKPEDYRKATMTVTRSAEAASAIWLPVVP